MDKKASKKPIFSTKDLPSSSTKNDSIPVKLRKKLKGKAQKQKKPFKKTEIMNIPSNASEISTKSSSEQKDFVNDILDPFLQKVLTFFLLKESYELFFKSCY